MNAPAISVRGVWKFFGDFPAVRDVSFEVGRGTVTALLGRNGAGKTTLLRMIAGLSRPSRGEFELGASGANPSGTNPSGATHSGTAARLGIVGHGQWIYDDLTAEENLQFFARLYNIAEPAATIARWLESTGLASFRHTRAGEFSRGMRQRLALARAFLHEPEILLLDEPWTALDDRAIDLLSSLLSSAHQQRRTVLVCSHQLTETLQAATHLLVLDRGRLAFAGENSAEFKTSPQNFYQRVL
jgi:ABC-type multidrug transport system ATPase subunit